MNDIEENEKNGMTKIAALCYAMLIAKRLNLALSA
jgi:hypothetical protein